MRPAWRRCAIDAPYLSVQHKLGYVVVVHYSNRVCWALDRYADHAVIPPPIEYQRRSGARAVGP